VITLKIHLLQQQYNSLEKGKLGKPNPSSCLDSPYSRLKKIVKEV
jgi:hypothetical protein